MSITDELREWIEGLYTPNSSTLKMEGERIADRIDAAHRSALEKLAAQVDESERIGFDQGFASADDWLTQNEDAMVEHGWMRLPVDADGMPIRVGDVMDFLGGMTVSAIGKDDVYFFADNYSDGVYTEASFHLRHHRTPTVEDVLREFALACEDAGNAGPEVERIAAEFAAKLRLAGEGE